MRAYIFLKLNILIILFLFPFIQISGDTSIIVSTSKLDWSQNVLQKITNNVLVSELNILNAGNKFGNRDVILYCVNLSTISIQTNSISIKQQENKWEYNYFVKQGSTTQNIPIQTYGNLTYQNNPALDIQFTTLDQDHAVARFFTPKFNAIYHTNSGFFGGAQLFASDYYVSGVHISTGISNITALTANSLTQSNGLIGRDAIEYRNTALGPGLGLGYQRNITANLFIRSAIWQDYMVGQLSFKNLSSGLTSYSQKQFFYYYTYQQNSMLTSFNTTFEIGFGYNITEKISLFLNYSKMERHIHTHLNRLSRSGYQLYGNEFYSDSVGQVLASLNMLRKNLNGTNEQLQEITFSFIYKF